ncbi:MAG: hypothetical protein SX243_24485, partial [Acidobacteriota bacterium]|nr:hypothetical protein [Acidobacteriota bacterium]
LSPDEVDLSQPVVVEVNGRQVFSDTVEPSKSRNCTPWLDLSALTTSTPKKPANGSTRWSR